MVRNALPGLIVMFCVSVLVVLLFPSQAVTAADSCCLNAQDPMLSSVVDASLVRPGDEVNFALTVTNPGSTAAFNVQVSDPLPGILVPLSASSPQGNSMIEGQVVLFNLGTVNAGQSVTLIITARARPDARPPADAINTATLRYTGSTQTASSTLHLTAGVLPATGEHPDEPLYDGMLLAGLLSLTAGACHLIRNQKPVQRPQVRKGTSCD